MGNWNISIRGIGSHHNPDNPTDADRMAAEFVEKLKAAGHTVSSAEITYGGQTVLQASDPGVSEEFYRTKPRGDVSGTAEQMADALQKRMGFHGLAVMNEYETMAVVNALKASKP